MRRPAFPRQPIGRLDVPLAQMEDEPQRCLQVNAEWLTFLAGQIEHLAYYWRYQQNTQEERDQIDENVQALLQRCTDAVECVDPVTYQLQVVEVQHRAAAGVHGGGTVPSSWSGFPMTHITRDDTAVCSIFQDSALAGLPAGDWNFEARHVLRQDAATGGARMRVQAMNLVQGENQEYRLGTNMLHCSGVLTQTIGGIIWQYYTTDARTTDGMGLAMNALGNDEVYGTMRLWRLHQVLP